MYWKYCFWHLKKNGFDRCWLILTVLNLFDHFFLNCFSPFLTISDRFLLYLTVLFFYFINVDLCRYIFLNQFWPYWPFFYHCFLFLTVLTIFLSIFLPFLPFFTVFTVIHRIDRFWPLLTGVDQFWPILLLLTVLTVLLLLTFF